MPSIFAEPWDPDAPLPEKLIARGPQLAVAAGMIMIAIRMVWLWTTGVIKTEPFWGSWRWNLAISIPTSVIFVWWWIIVSGRERERDNAVAALMPSEPLAGWHRRIRSFNAKLANATPSHSVDVRIRQLTLEIVEAYAGLDATRREHVRVLWRTYEDFCVYASVTDRADEGASETPMTVEDVRRELMLESIRDQHPDARDAVVGLADLARRATAAGIDFSALAREVADLSDDTRRNQMFGSTREVILGYARAG